MQRNSRNLWRMWGNKPGKNGLKPRHRMTVRSIRGTISSRLYYWQRDAMEISITALGSNLPESGLQWRSAWVCLEPENELQWKTEAHALRRQEMDARHKAQSKVSFLPPQGRKIPGKAHERDDWHWLILSCPKWRRIFDRCIKNFECDTMEIMEVAASQRRSARLCHCYGSDPTWVLRNAQQLWAFYNSSDKNYGPVLYSKELSRREDPVPIASWSL